MKKVLFIDRDGVLNQDNGYTFKVLKHDWQTKYFTYDCK